MPQLKLLFSPWYWFRKIALTAIKPLMPALIKAKKYTQKHWRIAMLAIIASFALVAIAQYCGLRYFSALCFAITAGFFIKKKRRVSAAIFLLAGILALIQPRAYETARKISAVNPNSREKVAKLIKEDASAPTTRTLDSTDKKPSITPENKDTSPTSYPPPENTPDNTQGKIKQSDDSRKSGDVVEKKVVQPKSSSVSCESKKNKGVTPTFQYGDFLIEISECYRDGTQERFSGFVRYTGKVKRLLVFHQFIVSDNFGEKYLVQEGQFGNSANFGMNYSYQWFNPGTPVISFSFVVGSIETHSKDLSFNLTMPFNQNSEGVTFSEIGEEQPSLSPVVQATGDFFIPRSLNQKRPFRVFFEYLT